MKPLQYSIFTFTIAAIFALGPVAGIVLIPNSWWGLAIKGVLFFILIGAVGNFLRPSPARERVYGGSAPGFVLIMPLFAATIWLGRGFWKTATAFFFLFFVASCFLMIYNNAVAIMGEDSDESAQP